jgi:asparagine synthase (glutamine-hydrolysing)
MCGVYYSSRIPENQREEELRNAIHHRGPDAVRSEIMENQFFMHSRLSIIDLSTGDQPMKNESESVAIIFNGEIYNFQDLKNQLMFLGQKFRTESDTEVILQGYQVWGMELLCQKLDGMFAFVLIDRRTNLLYAAVDKFGEKPLFIKQNGNSLEISSCLKSFQLNDCNAELAKYPLASYLTMGFNAFSESILEGVAKLPPSNYKVWDYKTSQVKSQKQYWSLVDLNGYFDYSDSELLEHLLEKAVTSRLIADVPVGLALSGGVDSSILAGIASKYLKNLQTFSIVFPDNLEFDESSQSKKISNHLGLSNISIPCGSKEFHNGFFEWNQFTDEPVLDPAVVPLSLLAKEASNFVKVLLSGEGADEIFGGYSYYFPKNMISNDLISRDINSNSFLNLNEMKLKSGFPLISNPKDVCEMMDLDLKSFQYSINEIQNERILRKTTPVRDKQVSDILNWLPNNLLIKLDRALMAHGIEGRVPFLSPDLVGLGLNLQDKEKYDDKITKVELRKVSDKLLGDSVRSYPKMGLIPPYAKFLQGLARDGEDVFESVFTAIGIKSSNALKFINSNKNSRFQYNAIALAYWMNRNS